MQLNTLPKFKSHQYVMYVVIILLMILCVQIPIFGGLSYRGDEAWRIHLPVPKENAELIEVLIDRAHNAPVGWLIAKYAANWFGQTEPALRYFFSFFSLLGLACIYRLTADLFGNRFGLLSLCLLAATPYMVYYLRDVGPYPILILTSSASMLIFLRYIRGTRPRKGLLYVIINIIGVYNHYFMIFLILAHWIYALLFLKPIKYTRLGIFLLCTSVAMAFILGWGLIILFMVKVSFSGGYQLSVIGDFPTVGIITLLLIFSFAFARYRVRSTIQLKSIDRQLFRYIKNWQLLFLGGISILTLLIICLVNIWYPIITLRNCLVASSFLIIAMTVWILDRSRYLLQRQRKFYFSFLSVLFALSVIGGNFLMYRVHDLPGPQRFVDQINELLQSDDQFIVNSRFSYRHILANYYLQMRLDPVIPVENLLYIQPWSDSLHEEIPYSPPNHIRQDTSLALDQIRTWIESGNRIWYMEFETDPTDYLKYDLIFADGYCEIKRIQANRYWLILTEPCEAETLNETD